MNTYLVTWNPQNSTWSNLSDHASQTQKGIRVHEPWSCGNTKRIAKDDRLFLLKQGYELPRGIMASGITTTDVFEEAHWDEQKAERGKSALYVDAEWEIILNPENEPLLPVSAFQYDELPTVHWKTQKSGILIPAQVAGVMELLWRRHVEAVRESGSQYSAISDDPEEEDFPEGRVLYRVHRTHERNPELVNRAKTLALKQGGTLAGVVCDFDFFKTYGSVGKHFIECHHTIPVSELSEGMTTKIADVVLVCSNCHRMLHRKRPWLKVEDLKALVSGK